MALPDFIIIGAMKCGTSTLHEQLARQPGIFMTMPKEPNFFSDDEQYARGEAWYGSLFTGAQIGDLRGESSTHYTKLPTYPNTVDRMIRMLPDVKLIYVIRHPIERLVSHYIHAWTENWLNEPIEQAIETYPSLIAYGEYANQIGPYLRAFGRDRIQIVFFERLVQKPQHVLEAVCRFIGYRGHPRWHDEAARQNVSSERLRKSRWRDAIVYAPLLSQVRRNVIPRGVREWVKGLWRMADRPRLSSSIIAKLEERFDQDLSQLGRWCDVSISCRNFREVALSYDLRWTNVEAVPHT